MSGLRVVIDAIVSPKEAFESLREQPAWLWAALVFIILFSVGTYLELPASTHASVGMIQHMIANNTMIANMSDAQKADMLQKAQHPSPFAPLQSAAFMFVGILLNALWLWITGRSSSSPAKFSSFWAASLCNAVASIGLAVLCVGIIAAIRGPEAFNSIRDLLGALPNLGMLAPFLSGFLYNTLIALNVFVIWGFFLNVFTLRWTAGITSSIQYIVPAIITLLSVMLQAFFLGFGG